MPVNNVYRMARPAGFAGSDRDGYRRDRQRLVLLRRAGGHDSVDDGFFGYDSGCCVCRRVDNTPYFHKPIIKKFLLPKNEPTNADRIIGASGSSLPRSTTRSRRGRLPSGNRMERTFRRRD